MSNLFPTTLGTDIASTTTSFLSTPGLLNFMYLLFGVLFGFMLIEFIIDSANRKAPPTGGWNDQSGQ